MTPTPGALYILANGHTIRVRGVSSEIWLWRESWPGKPMEWWSMARWRKEVTAGMQEVGA